MVTEAGFGADIGMEKFFNIKVMGVAERYLPILYSPLCECVRSLFCFFSHLILTLICYNILDFFCIYCRQRGVLFSFFFLFPLSRKASFSSSFLSL